MDPSYALTEKAPWLVARFAAPQRILSWTLNKPGFQAAAAVAWLEVRDNDLPRDRDPRRFLERSLASAGLADAPAFLTSRGLEHHVRTSQTREGVRADCTITLGLSNAERVGERSAPRGPLPVGTINLLCQVSVPLSDAAMLEALSVATQARTVAVLEHSHVPAGSRAPVTGTGTDCIAIACPPGPSPQLYAGLHTSTGEAIGAAVLRATERAVSCWIEGQGLTS